MSKPRLLLPDTARPSKYVLRLRPDLENATFRGEEQVHITITKPTDRLVLHAAELTLSNVTLKAGEATLSPNNVVYEQKTETVDLSFDSQLATGEAILSLHFDGILNKNMKGFYASKYTVEGVEKTMAVTQFEPADARRAFPCWDEPELKAEFEITLEVPQDPKLHAISNMPVASEAIVEGLRAVTFEPTPKMSTYLAAFIVGEFDYLEQKDRDGVTIRVYTPPGRSNHGEFALSVAAQTLPYYNDYFKIPYPLPKIDLIAIPDFAAGAMENWGCVTFRETALLVDPKASSSHTKQWVALVVGHELAHQWFGNIVTMSWWTDLWLNEGFASWIEYLCVDHCYPAWDIWTQFVYADMNRALQLDALKNSHPVEVEVSEVSEIDEIFDIISYSKGCSVVRMLSSYIGETKFREGLHQYLKKHSYKNAITNDLWESLEEASGKPIRSLMDNWTRKTGFPVLSITRQPSSSTSSKFKITQSRFLASGQEEDPTVWMVPLNYISGASSTPSEYQIVSEKEVEIEIPLSPETWIKFNASQSGFYRVLYSPELLQGISKALLNKEITSATDRIGIQSDAFALARNGLLSTDEVLKLVSSYKQETNYTVWADLSSNLNALEILLDQTEHYENFKAFGRQLYQPVLAEVGWEKKPDEPMPTSLLRTLVLARLCRYNDEKVVQKIISKFNNNEEIDPDLSALVYRTVIAHGGVKEYEEIFSRAQKADIAEEKLRLLVSLGNAKQTDLLTRTLELAFSEHVRYQDAVMVFSSVSANPLGRHLAWNYVKENWSKIKEVLTGLSLLTRLISNSTSDFSSEKMAVEVDEFFQANPVPVERTIRQAIETIRASATWFDRDYPKISSFLVKNFPVQ